MSIRQVASKQSEKVTSRFFLRAGFPFSRTNHEIGREVQQEIRENHLDGYHLDDNVIVENCKA